ncbi:MAG: IPT/TIG domain-containing protein, partial [Planctomycetota bacterium]
MSALRFSVFGLFFATALHLTGCAAGVGTLVGLILLDDDDPGVLRRVSVVSISPRQSAVVGGVQITVRGKNFDPNMLLSIGGKEIEDFEFIDDETVRAIVPFNDAPLSDPDDPDSYRTRYSLTSDIRLQVATDTRGAS